MFVYVMLDDGFILHWGVCVNQNDNSEDDNSKIAALQNTMIYHVLITAPFKLHWHIKWWLSWAHCTHTTSINTNIKQEI